MGEFKNEKDKNIKKEDKKRFCCYYLPVSTQRTRLRRICAKLICVFAQIYVVKKAWNRRKFAVKPSQRRYFAPIFALFFNISINRRNFDVKPSQRR